MQRGVGSGFFALLSRITRCCFLFQVVRCEPGEGSYLWKGWQRQYGLAPASPVAHITVTTLPHLPRALRAAHLSPNLKVSIETSLATRRPPSRHIGVFFLQQPLALLAVLLRGPSRPLEMESWGGARPPGTCVRCSPIGAQAAGPPRPGNGAPPAPPRARALRRLWGQKCNEGSPLASLMAQP